MKNNKKSIDARSTITVDLNEVAKSLVIERSRAVLIDKIEQIIYPECQRKPLALAGG